MKKETIEEFLKRGGKIEKVKPGAAAVLGSLDKSKIPHYDNDDVKKGKAHGTAPLPEYKNTKPNTYHDYDLGGDKIPVFEPKGKDNQ
jgi:hypothetical protein